MAVRSQDLRNGQPSGRAVVAADDSAEVPQQHAPPVRRNDALWPAGLLMLGFGAPLWVWGAKYSMDGWIIGLNMLLENILHVAVRIPQPGGWWMLIIVPLGILYSFVEVKVRPRWGAPWRVLIAMTVLFLLAHGSDLGTTFAGVTAAPGAGAWPLTTWVATHFYVAALWAIILTYLPEVLILVGMSFIVRSGRRRA
ncbi:MAG TPA: hypothetical protein VFT66_15545 [Roseiflexaceae bacterium]|nr:hypothetical protein [Roseiflexaceae bacterium]